MSEKPICTVLLIAYNHAPYIRNAIDSVLAQKTKYPFIIKIFDDASTDGSSDIIREYAEKYPDKIEAHIREENVGAQTNIWEAYESVDTEYCCILETDDFWCDNDKLELQITALEEHPECSFAAGNTTVILTENTSKYDKHEPERYFNDSSINDSSVISYSDIKKIEHHFMPHSNTRLIRMSQIDMGALKNKESFLFDQAQLWFLFSKGKMFYHKRIFSKYLKSGVGISQSKDCRERLEMFIRGLLDVDEDTNHMFWEKIYSYISLCMAWRLKNEFNIPVPKKPAPNKPAVCKIQSKIYYVFGLPIFKIKTKGSSKYFYILGIRVLKISIIDEFKGK